MLTWSKATDPQRNHSLPVGKCNSTADQSQSLHQTQHHRPWDSLTLQASWIKHCEYHISYLLACTTGHVQHGNMLRGDWSGFFQSQSEAMKKFNKPTKEGRSLVTETEEVLMATGSVSALTEPWTGHGVVGGRAAVSTYT